MELIVVGTAVYLLLTAVITYVGYRIYVRPARYYEQLGRKQSSLGDLLMGAESEESLRRIVAKLTSSAGEKVPVSPEEVHTARQYLRAAGFRSESAVPIYLCCRVLLTGVALLGGFLLRGALAPAGPLQMAVVVVLGAVGHFGGGMILEFIVARRQQLLREALPDALDLLVICVEAGLGLDQAFLNVARELAITHPALSDELRLMLLEMQAGKRRADALRSLGARTGEDEVRRLVAMLVQTDRFGTSIADSLRSHSDSLRVQRRQEAEERANKVGVKLVFPIFFGILPSMFLVTAGPGLLQVFKQLLPVMKQFSNK